MDWEKILADEERIIRNADRRFRRHSYSLESMSEELVHMECRLIERSDPLEVVLITDFVDTVQNERLAAALRQLTDRQRRMIGVSAQRHCRHHELQAEHRFSADQPGKAASLHHTDQINDLKQDQHPQVLVLP